MNERNLLDYMEKEIKNLLSSLDISTVKREAKIRNQVVDLLIKTKKGKKILVELKSSGEPSYIYKAISQLKYYQLNEKEYLMVAVPNISEKSKEICKSAGIGYIDLKGNVFIKYNDILIDKVQNRDLPEKFLPMKKRVKDLFSGNSLRVLIKLLNNPNQYFTQEELAIQLNLSKPYINRILKTFEEGIKEDGEILLVEGPRDKSLIKNYQNAQIIGGFDWVEVSSNKGGKITVFRKTKKYKITKPKILLDILAKKYDFNKNRILSFYSFEKDRVKLINMISQTANKNKLNYALTLHAGASSVAPFVRFEDVYFYVNENDIKKWANLLDLKRTEFGGNVFLVVPQYDWILYDSTKINKKKIVNKIMLYLDLVNYAKRGKEQAEFLREKKIGF